ncbi:hypothetical protein PUMCH_002855 [Australozyma saopauloensis]|uniref:Uncharacterized protein n=1 Tax=Australozyma saopauloensis TaxID=291208 RepID=A0AAX4HAH8_9ASCO|nr:hypothetical protein PUMCH_002855 [[Candida] saopauloensis]
MSKIDQLLVLADSITTSSEVLLNRVNELNLVVSLLMDIHHSIISADTEIDNYTQLISRNNSYLNEMQKLHEKSYFLEVNMPSNDIYTNETSYSNLYKEYTYLWRNFGFDNLNFAAEEDDVPEPEQRSRLNHMLSILNLNLKPLRCKSTKVEKKKSRYRLSGAFNFNPLAPNLPPIPDLQQKETLQAISESGSSRYVLNASSSDISSIMDERPHRDSIASTHSFGLHRGSNVENHQDANLPLTLDSFTGINIDEFDMSSVQHLDFDYDSYSPDRNFDNFNEFLRKSRIDLQGQLPTLKKSVSYESVFSAPVTLTVEAPKKFHNPVDILYTQKRETLTQQTVEAIYSLPFDAPLNFKELSKKLLIKKSDPIEIGIPPHTDTTTATLTPTRKSSYGLFQLMNSPLGSPRGLKDSQFAQSLKPEQQDRKGSIDSISKSLATSFLNLVGTSPIALNTISSVPCSTHSPPEKIKKMKKDLKEPISVNNDFMAKRRPPLDREKCTKAPVKSPLFRKECTKPPILSLMKTDLLKDAFKESLFF